MFDNVPETVSVVNREAWLNLVVERFRPWFIAHGFEIPEKVKVTVGFPFRGKKNTVGQCFSEKASTGNYWEIFIHPKIDDPFTAICILCHELVHTVVGTEHGHDGVFGACFYAVGMTGKKTQCEGGEHLKVWFDLQNFPPFPHASLMTGNRAKQKTNLIKVECNECGFICRTTQKWLDKAETFSCMICQSENLIIG